MNSNFCGPQARRAHRTLLTRSWKRSLMLALVTLMSVASAFAAPGVQVGNQNMFRPSWDGESGRAKPCRRSRQ